MARTVDQLPAATVVNPTDNLLVSQLGLSKKATQALVVAGAGGGGPVRFPFNEEVDGAVVGLAEVSIGMMLLVSGTTFDAVAMIGTQGGADSAVLRLRRFTGGAQVASWTRAGLLASTAISAAYVVAATDWYEFTLATTGAGEVALCKGLHGSVV